MREGSGMQRGTIGGGVFRSFALEYNPISHWGVLDESSNFFLSIFINEDEGVMFGVSSIVFVPSFPRMH